MLYYRTKKYIFRSIRYSLIFVAVISLYIIAAHNNKLLIIFERFNGDFVRKHTKGIYSYFLGEKTQQKHPQKTKDQNKLLWNILDTVTFDDNYTEARSKLNTLSGTINQLPFNRKDTLKEFASDPSIRLFSVNPGDTNADIFRYEILRRFESLKYIDSFALFSPDGKALLKSANFASPMIRLIENEDQQITANGFYQVIRDDNKTIAILQGTWNYWHFPDLPYVSDLGKNIAGLIVDKDGRVLSETTDLPQYIKIDIVNGIYTGYFNARVYPYRYSSSVINNAHFIIVTPATSLAFYVYRILLYFLFLVLLGYTIYILRKILPGLKISQYFDGQKSWLEKGLQEAVDLNQQAIKIAADSQLLLVEVKQQEARLLESISENIQKIKVYQKSKMIYAGNVKPMSGFEGGTKSRQDESEAELPQVTPIAEENEEDFSSSVSQAVTQNISRITRSEVTLEPAEPTQIPTSQDENNSRLVLGKEISATAKPDSVMVKSPKNDDWLIADSHTDNHENKKNNQILKGSDLEVDDKDFFVTLDYEMNNKEAAARIHEPVTHESSLEKGSDNRTQVSPQLSPLILESSAEEEVVVIDELENINEKKSIQSLIIPEETIEKTSLTVPSQPLFIEEDIDRLVEKNDMLAEMAATSPSKTEPISPLFDEDMLLEDMLKNEGGKAA